MANKKMNLVDGLHLLGWLYYYACSLLITCPVYFIKQKQKILVDKTHQHSSFLLLSYVIFAVVWHLFLIFFAVLLLLICFHITIKIYNMLCTFSFFILKLTRKRRPNYKASRFACVCDMCNMLFTIVLLNCRSVNLLGEFSKK